MNLIGLPETEVKAFLVEATGLMRDARAFVGALRTMVARMDNATTSAAAGWQVPPPPSEK